MTKLVLASASWARSEMLRNAGVDFAVQPARVDEAAIKEGMQADGAPPVDAAQALADLKAMRILPEEADALVIGADQILECDGELFSKPVDRVGAAAQLRRLRGCDHDLVSVVCVVRGGQRVWHHLDRAHLKMRAFSDDFLEDYLDAVGDTVLEGPGGYRVEGRGAQLFSRITGDYFTILGLPLLPLLDYLRIQDSLQT